MLRWGLVFFLSFALLFFVFWPVSQNSFAPQDQLRTFRYGVNVKTTYANCMKNIHVFYLITGRPLVPIGECFEHAHSFRVKDFRRGRIINLLFLALIITLTAFYLERQSLSIFSAFALSVSIYLLPGISFFLLQGGTAGMIFLCLLVSLIAMSLLVLPKKGSFDPPPLNAPRILGFLGLFFAALWVYPAYCYFALILPAATILLNPRVSTSVVLKRFIVCVSLVLGASAIYFGCVKLVTRHIPVDTILAAVPQYSFKLNLSIIQKLKFFVVDIIPGIPLWFANADGSILLRLGIYGLMVLGAIFGLVRHLEGGKKWNDLAIRFGIILCVPVLIELPWIISNSWGNSFRYIFPVAAFVLLIDFWAIREILRKDNSTFPALLVLSLAVAGTSYTINRDVQNSTLEFAYIRNSLAAHREDLLGSHIVNIHIIRPGGPYNGLKDHRGEINAVAMEQNPEHVAQIITAAFRDIFTPEDLSKYFVLDCRFDRHCVSRQFSIHDKDYKTKWVVVSQSQSFDQSQPTPSDENIVIDMRKVIIGDASLKLNSGKRLSLLEQ